MALQKFKSFIRDRQGSVSTQAGRSNLKRIRMNVVTPQSLCGPLYKIVKVKIPVAIFPVKMWTFFIDALTLFHSQKLMQKGDGSRGNVRRETSRLWLLMIRIKDSQR